MYEALNSHCRLCLSEETLDGVLVEDGCYQWISDYLSIQIKHNDKKSQVICVICHLRLAEFHDFRTSCRKVQEVLQTRTEKSSNKSTVEEAQKLLQADEKPSIQPENESQTSETLKCPKCSRLFTSKKQLWNHTQFHKRKEQGSTKRLQCEVCEKLFDTRKQLCDHKRYHESRKHVCTYCEKSFDRRGRLRNHMTLCFLRMKKKLKDLKESASNNEEYTCDLLQIMETEANNSSIEVLLQDVEEGQGPESEECETYEVVVYAENSTDHKTSVIPKVTENDKP